jgi:serine/threonine-protein kinase
LTATVPLTPPDLDRIVRRCLAKDREDRWQSARDVSLELRSVGEAATPAEAARPGRPTTTGRRALAMASSALIGALLGGLAVRGFLRPHANPNVAPVTRFALNFPATEPLEGTDVAISADGKRLAYVRTRGGTRFLYVRSLDQMQDETIAGTEGAEHPFFSPDGQWIGFSSGGKLLRVSLRGGAPVVLCDAESMTGASWGRDGWIVFAPSQTGGLFRVSSEGGTPSPLTRLDAARGDRSHRWPQILPGADAVLFSAAPDWLMDPIGVAVFSSKTGQTRVLIKQATSAVYLPDGLLVYKLGPQLLAASFDISRLELTGAPVVVLDHIPDDERSYAVSASGSLVYLPVSGSDTPQRSLCWVDRAGKREALGAPPKPLISFPTLSPDGQRLAVSVAESQKPQVWIYDLRRGTFSPLTFEGSNHFNVWTPDGQGIITSSTRTGPANLYELRADGNGPPKPLLRRPHHEDPGSCSPDGKYVAFTEIDPVSQWDIWVLPLQGDRVPKPFLQTRFSEINPMFSPDGRWLAYTSNESGRSQVYVEPFPGPGAKVEVSTDGGREPLWSRDGRELFYWSGQKLMLVDVGTGPSFNASRPRMLLEGPYVRSIGYGSPNYDITPDGQRFVMVQGETSPRTQMDVVTNWVEEWKGRVRREK